MNISFRDFLRDKSLFITASFIIAGFSTFLLLGFGESLGPAIFVPALFFAAAVLSLIPEYYVKSRYFRNLRSVLDGLDEKRLLSEIIERPEFFEGALLYDILRQTNKSMNDEVAKHRFASIEYREFIELWVHEIKTPIAGAKLICENTRSTALLAELGKIERLVEQALYYARSSNVEKDYMIKKVQLSSLANAAIRTDAGHLIAHKIKVDSSGLDLDVFTDSKWVVFIIRQLIGNSVKYGAQRLEFRAAAHANSISLYIRDDGCGIPAHDVPRVFDKGFTGENGRRFGASTGLGLYLCKQMCTKLGLDIRIASAEGEWTEAEIIFPKSDMYFG